MKLRRKILATATALLLAGGLAAVPVASASAATVPHVPVFSSDLTLESGIIQTIISTPSGNEQAVLGRFLFTVHGQPIAGSIDAILQEKTRSGWFDATSAPRVNFPLDPPVRGFQMVAGPYLCSGTNNYWRMAFLIHAESSTGNWQGPVTYYFTNGDGTTQMPGGVRINCG